MRGATAEEWKEILSRLNASTLNSEQLKPYLTSEELARRWCGRPPAMPAEIAKAEARLRAPLPPSYKAFLSVANGWHLFGHFIERLLPVGEIDWLRSADPEGLSLLQEAYQEDDISDEDYLDYEADQHMEALRHRYYPECLLISRTWEGEMILLNSRIVFPDGEWEAIFFADWIPGNQRYRTFYDLASKTRIL